jgi:ABC-type lipoprotein export system ATPase subunit
VSLAVAGVSHAYRRGQPVLRGVSLEVTPDRSIALVGPSGSGKTTLLSVLGLLTTPGEGSVLIDGVPVRARDRNRVRGRHFGWVFQGTNVLGRRSALDNASLGLLAGGASTNEAHAAAAAMLDAVGIGALVHAPAYTLSGGELQRVCIARVLAARPRFVLADEPTGQLDTASTEVVIRALVTNRPTGTSIVIATHDPQVAGRCDIVVRLVDGRIAELSGR